MKLLRITNSQDISPSADFTVQFNEDIIINEFTKIGLISAQIPLKAQQVIVDEDNKNLVMGISGAGGTNIILEEGTYDSVTDFADMVAKVLNASIDGSDADETGAFIQTTTDQSNITFNYFKTGQSVMALDLQKVIVADASGDLSVPVGTNNYNNVYIFQNQPVQFTGCNITTVMASKMSSTGANPATYMSDCKIGIVSQKMDGTFFNPVFDKFIGLNKQGNYSQFIKGTAAGFIRIHVDPADLHPLPSDYALPGDVLALEFGGQSVKYVLYRPIDHANINDGIANDYMRCVLDEEPWTPDTNNTKYYIAASMLNRSAVDTFYMSTPRVVNSPIYTLQGDQIVDAEVKNVHHDFNFSVLPPLGYRIENLPTTDENGDPISYGTGVSVIPPVPNQNGNFVLAFPSQESMDLMGFDVDFINLPAPKGTVKGKLGYASDKVAKSILVELMNINSIQSFDSTLKGRRNIIAVIPRTDLDNNNLLIYNPPVPIMIDLNNLYRISLRNLHFRLLTFNYSLVELNDTVDLVFVLE